MRGGRDETRATRAGLWLFPYRSLTLSLSVSGLGENSKASRTSPVEPSQSGPT